MRQQPIESVCKLAPVEGRVFDLGFEAFQRAGNRAQITIAALLRILVEEIGSAPQIGNCIFSSVFRERIVRARVGHRTSRGERIDRSQMKKDRNKPERWQEPNGTRRAESDNRARVYAKGAAFHIGEQCATDRIERRVRRRAFIDFERRAQPLA